MKSIKHRFIKNTDRRYSVCEQGIVYSHYRYRNNGERDYQLRVVAKNIDSPDRPHAKVVLFTRGGRQAFMVNSLMITYFNLTPPDKHHIYDLKQRDGDCFNHALGNLYFRIRHSTPFYPQPFYRGTKIVAKRCGECGIKKHISHFTAEIRNDCNACRAEKNWSRILASPVRLRRHLAATRAWALSAPGSRYLRRYYKDVAARDKAMVSLHYVAASQKIYKLGLKEKDLPEEFVTICRSYILLKRKINEKSV